MLYTHTHQSIFQFTAKPEVVNGFRIGFPLFLIIIFACCLIGLPDIIISQPMNLIVDRTYDAGLGVGFVGGGEVTMDFDPYVTKKTKSFLVKGYYDSYLIPRLAAGVYFHIATTPVNMHYADTEYESEWINNQWVYTEQEVEYSYDLACFTWEIGASIKPRYFFGESWAVKPGLNIGYRKFYFNEDDLKEADVLWLFEEEDQKPEAAGMALNGSLEVQYHLPQQNYFFFGEVGMLNQPYGGTHHVTDMNFALIFYVLFGVAF